MQLKIKLHCKPKDNVSKSGVLANKSESRKAALSPLQKEYRKFIRKVVKEKGQDHPFEGNPDEIADLFEEISKGWKKHKKTLA
jgi:hypothetical protein